MLSQIQVISATYGGNCGAASNNVKPQLATACNGKNNCDYIIDFHQLGDPSPGCAKNFTASWICTPGGPARNQTVAAEAGLGSHLALSCGVPIGIAGQIVGGGTVPTNQLDLNVSIDAQVLTSPVLSNAAVVIQWHLKNTTILPTTGVVSAVVDDGTALAVSQSNVNLPPAGQVTSQFSVAPQKSGTHIVSILYSRDTGDTMRVPDVPTGIQIVPRCEAAGSVDLSFMVTDPMVDNDHDGLDDNLESVSAGYLPPNDAVFPRYFVWNR